MGAPKLLDKRTVNAEVATQKKVQIDSGLALAKKVDAVRETLQEEEARLEEFRKMTIARVYAEINIAIFERDKVLSDIEKRQQELITLRKPIDDEWKAVQLMVDDVDSTRQLVYSMKGELQEKIDENIKLKSINQEETQRIAMEREQSRLILSNAEELRKDAVNELMKARALAEEIIEEAKIRESAVGFRENNVEGLDRNNSIERKRLTEWEINLSNREKKLRVNQAILIKSENFIKK